MMTIKHYQYYIMNFIKGFMITKTVANDSIVDGMCKCIFYTLQFNTYAFTF